MGKISSVKRRVKAIAQKWDLAWKQFGILRRLRPISRQWGFDRGQPIDRYYIELFLEKFSSDIHGRVLEFCDPTYTRKYGGSRVLKSDVLNLNDQTEGTTMIADLASADSIPSEIFDCIICTQVLQYVYDTKAAVYHLHRLLKPGGVVLVSVPGVSKKAREWSDFWRFTTLSAGRLFNEFFTSENIEVSGYGNVLVSIASLHGLAREEFKKKELDFIDRDYETLITVRAVKPSRQ